MAQGRGNAKAILCVLALLAFSHAVAAKDITVGGATQKWDFPPGTDTGYYDTWSAATTFAVGDNLVFQYTPGEHDVQMVTAAEYNGCLGTSTNAKLTSGSDKVPLPKAGDYYFICTFPTHCESGMKVKVTVGAAAPPATPPATPPTPPPATPPTPPPATPPTPPPATPPTPPPATPPTPPPTTPPTPPPATPPVHPPAHAPAPVIVAPVRAPTIAPTPVPVVAPPTTAPAPSPTSGGPAPASTGSPKASPAPAPGSAHSVRVGFGVVGAAVVAAIGALLF